jgi:hypothetical protein
MNRKTVLRMILSLAVVAGAAAPVLAEETVFEDLVEPYEAIRVQLLDDHTEDVTRQGKALQATLEALHGDFSAARAGVSKEDGETLQGLLPGMIEAARRLAQAPDLQSARDAFYDLSKPMVRYHAMLGEKAGTVAVYCSMARRSWLQPAASDIGNPYHGQAMARCGEVVGE